MSTRGYGQYCGFARALELVGERWGLLIVRDLFTGPKRFSELQRGLAKIPSNILTTRLKELEESGVVERVAQRNPRGVFYQLTADGRELEDAVVALSRWGAKRLGERREGEIVTESSMTMALRTIFRPQEAAGDPVTYQVYFGDIALHARVRDAAVTVGAGEISKPDLVIRARPEIKRMFDGEITPKQALASGIAAIEGKHAHFDRFARMFRI